ncbi:hypothetical protein J4Q44_G00190620 [Coregonus suidteri]|uniref:Alpha-carbonic anhydrase domain-containing protein n=1 Tax=Coregonus suidteri TaxID=861788 RepID=A0AAN8LM83_9TELE
MNRLVVIVATLFVPTAYSAADGLWCYHDPSCDDTTWSTIAMGDTTLTAFTFTKYGDNSTMKTIKNTGNTVKVELMSGVQVTGGALSEAYDSLQFHLHGATVPQSLGRSTTVDGTRYPMELHIVNAKSSHNGNTTSAIADSTGLAALGFFIEAMPGNATGSPAAWNTLTSYLANITLKDEHVNITHAISLDELLEGVDRTKYYRYLGSLTTPNCNEAVVWTVFKDPIKVSKDLIDLFSTTVHIDHNTTSALMTNTFRNIQPVNDWVVTTQGRTASGASTTCSSLGLMALACMLLRV